MGSSFLLMIWTWNFPQQTTVIHVIQCDNTSRTLVRLSSDDRSLIDKETINFT